MTNEKLYEVLGDINEKHVKEAREYHKVKKPVWVKWGAIAACLCLVVVGALTVPTLLGEPQSNITPGTNIVQPGKDNEVTQPGKANLLVVNEVENVMSADMDVQFTSFSKLPYDVWKSILDEFHALVGITYEEFTDKIPNEFEQNNFYSLSTRGYKDANLKDEYRLHDYVFEYQTTTGGEARIAICPAEKPLRDCIIKCDNPKSSEISGATVTIYGYQGIFMAEFTHNNINYDIETSDITLETLEDLLLGIIA